MLVIVNNPETATRSQPELSASCPTTARRLVYLGTLPPLLPCYNITVRCSQKTKKTTTPWAQARRSRPPKAPSANSQTEPPDQLCLHHCRHRRRHRRPMLLRGLSQGELQKEGVEENNESLQRCHYSKIKVGFQATIPSFACL